MNSTKALSTLVSWKNCRVPTKDDDRSDWMKAYCTERCGHVAVCVKDELFIWGGYNHPDYIQDYLPRDEVWSYSLEFDTTHKYKPKGTPPGPASGASSALLWPFWYIVCGHSNGGNTNQVVRLNLLTCTWERSATSDDLKKQVSPRDKAACWAYLDRLYIFGGYGLNPHQYCWNEAIDTYTRASQMLYEWEVQRGWNDQLIALDIKTNEWTSVDTKGPKPVGRAAHAAVRVENYVFIFGGRYLSQRMSDLHRLNLEDFSWSGKLECNGEPPEGRSWHSLCCVSKHSLLLYGGYNGEEQILDDLWHLSINTLTWTLLTRHTGLPRLWHSCCVNSHGDMLIFGGCTSNILDHTRRMETSDLVLSSTLRPFSLERLCLHALWRYRDQCRSTFNSLVKDAQIWLDMRTEAFEDDNRNVFRCCATSIYGPSLQHLSVLGEEEASRLNQVILEREDR